MNSQPATKQDTSAPTVSVLVTVYNREAHLEACVNSILNSSYEDYEVIIVDDCSKDRSRELMRELATRDPRISIYFNETNLRDYPNRNRAASLAKGKYIKYVDADDIIYSHSLAFMVESMEAHPEAALGIQHSEVQEEQPYPWRLTPEQAYNKQFLNRGCLSSGPSGAIIRRDAFEEVGRFSAYGVVSDVDMWLRLAARWPVILFPPGLIWWRTHEGQEFRSKPAQQEYLILGHEATMRSLDSQSCPLKPADIARAKTRLKQHHARRILAIALKGRNASLAWDAYRQSGLTLGELAQGLSKYR